MSVVVSCRAGQEVLLQVLEQQQLLSDRVLEELTLVRLLHIDVDAAATLTKQQASPSIDCRQH
jgi:hypothetical protein